MDADQLGDAPAIAGFWRRVAAFSLDGLVLGAVGGAIGLIAFEELVRLGPWGRLIGFFVALAYFGVLNSRLAGGQTLGKRLLKLKVIAGDGAALPVPRSVLRFLPVGAAWFLNGARFPESEASGAWPYVVSIAVFGLGFSILYLYVFNRTTRQSLHDLLVGSLVVSSDSVGPVATSPVWQPHLVVCGVLLLASGAAPYLTSYLAVEPPFAALLNVTRDVGTEPRVVNARAGQGTTSFTSLGQGTSESSFWFIVAEAKDPDIERVERAKRLVDLALQAEKSVANVDIIQVKLGYGYDLGIASSWRWHHWALSPEEWRVK